jgi:hypothetical protein
MHPADRFALFATAVDELLTENAGKVTDADRHELAELIAEFTLDKRRDPAEVDLQMLNEWLSRFATRLRARSY